MKIFKNKAWLGMAILVITVGLAGCSSDPVAPKDDLPTLTEEGAAGQSMAIALALTQVGPYITNPSGATKVIEDITLLVGDVTGTAHIDFRTGVDGPSATAAVATWAHLYTDDGAPIVVNLGDLGGQTFFDLDVFAGISRDPDTVTILDGSSGRMVSGDLVTLFTMNGLVIDGGDYPASGTVSTVPMGGPAASITFNGTNRAQASVGSSFYEVNLDTGEVLEIFLTA